MTTDIDSFNRYWWSKDPTILLDKRHNWPHSTKRWSHMLPSLDDYLYAKNLRYRRFLPETLVIKESCNLIGWDTQLAISTQSGSLWCYLLLMINFMQKTKRFMDFFLRYWWSRNPGIWFELLEKPNQKS